MKNEEWNDDGKYHAKDRFYKMINQDFYSKIKNLVKYAKTITAMKILKIK